MSGPERRGGILSRSGLWVFLSRGQVSSKTSLIRNSGSRHLRHCRTVVRYYVAVVFGQIVEG